MNNLDAFDLCKACHGGMAQYLGTFFFSNKTFGWVLAMFGIDKLF